MNSLDWDSMPAFLTVPQLAAFFGIGRATAYNLTHRKDFPSIKIGKKIRINKDGLRLWVDSNQTNNEGNNAFNV